MSARVITRMGDGTAVEMTRDELRADIGDGARQGARKAKAPDLAAGEIDHLLEVFAAEERMTGVPPGQEVVLSWHGSNSLHPGRIDCLTEAELMGGDLCELEQQDWSYKAVKTILASEQRLMQEA